MWPESSEKVQPLRTGFTTGCCATACSIAAAQHLLIGHPPQQVSVTLPKGKVVQLSLSKQWCDKQVAYAATVKDAGDDPDVTHGATVFVKLGLTAEPGIRFHAGPGVGTVTREGLALAVGEPAINPVPRQMITEHLSEIARQRNYQGGFEVTVGIENGEALAAKTMNGRLGILGGLSILGTTGIVRPFSCSAYIASIHQAIDVAHANGRAHIAATTGSTSEHAIREYYDLDDMALVEMGDFVGAVLKYMKRVPVSKLSICGGFGKISKLANGHLDLHSRASSVDFEHLAGLAGKLGGDPKLQQKVKTANTSIEALNSCQQDKVDLAAAVCEAALTKARTIVPDSVELEVWAIDRPGHLIGHADSSGLSAQEHI